MSDETASPSIDPKRIKPGRLWYVLAAIIMVVGVGAGITVFGFGVSSVAGSIPQLSTNIATGSPTEVRLSKGEDLAVYVEYPGDEAPVVECTVESKDGEATLSSSNTSFTFSGGGDTWHLAYDLTIDSGGHFFFTCESDQQVSGFAIGEAVDVDRFVGGIFGTIGGLIGISCFSLVVGGVIILVVALRRSSSRKNLRTRPRRPDAPGAW